MRTQPFDPEHLDVAAFAVAGGELAGQWSLIELERLCSSTDKQVAVTSADAVTWQLSGQRRRVRGSDEETWLTIKAQTTVSMTCQRCLQPTPVALHLNHDVQFVAGEEAAAALDADSDEDVLALSRSLNAKLLIEDELLLALPLVPRHESCPHPLVPIADNPKEEAPEHPFAALAQWKSSGGT